MNRLWVRLSLAFIVVAQVAIIVVVLFALGTANSELQRYVVRRTVPGGPEELVAFFERNGSWNGVANLFSVATTPSAVSGTSTPLTNPDRGNFFGSTALLADSNGAIVYDATGQRIGQQLTADERTFAITINTASDTTIGYLVPPPPPRALFGAEARGPEHDFFIRLRSSLFTAALVVGILGIVIALFVTRTLVAPLASLSAAARAFATHQWDMRVKAQGAREIAEVATAFNEMADELQHADILRRNLIADIAHELRTPLTVMQGNLRALLDGVYPLELSEISTLYDETRLLSRLVDDLRELAMADAGRLDLNVEPLNLGEVIQMTVSSFSAAADDSEVTIHVEGFDGLPLVRADRDRVVQVVRNLLVNAMRYTRGQVTISANALPNHGKNAATMIKISVQDMGEGILPEDLPHVFDRFYRGDRSRARTSGGTGLGLAIARAWVEAMGGKIGVDSKPGQGSRFWFTLLAAP
ncbi:MAG TPA: HAMP domain-containing sensor histidine kinase [Aggregatilineales bacterium]|nr:HAMP domain-containing sensor histidine kinase [Aggregatilineales bacterium]